MKRSDIDRIRSSLVLFAISWAVIAILSIVLIWRNEERNTHLTQRVERIEKRQLDLIKYNDCFVCHEEGKRCELINGVVWEWEDE